MVLMVREVRGCFSFEILRMIGRERDRYGG